MGRIHDALRRAERERARVLGLPPEPLPPAVAAPDPSGAPVPCEVRRGRFSERLTRLPPLSEYEETRLRIEQVRRQRALRSLVVAGGTRSDGRTTTALQLARSFAHSGSGDVALVDLDLDQPGVSTWLESVPELGVDAVLADERTLDAALIQIEASHLYVLPAVGARRETHAGARADSAPAAGIRDRLRRRSPLARVWGRGDRAHGTGTGDDAASRWHGMDLVALARLAAALHRRFELSVVDAPELLLAPGPAAEVISSFDGWLLVVRAGVTTTDDIDRMLGRLDGDKLVGTVLNRSRP